jgi:hypothetical protein
MCTVCFNITNIINIELHTVVSRAFFLGGRKGTRTPKHFVNLTGESRNFKMLEFPLNKLQILSIDCFYFF